MRNQALGFRFFVPSSLFHVSLFEASCFKFGHRLALVPFVRIMVQNQRFKALIVCHFIQQKNPRCSETSHTTHVFDRLKHRGDVGGIEYLVEVWTVMLFQVTTFTGTSVNNSWVLQKFECFMMHIWSWWKSDEIMQLKWLAREIDHINYDHTTWLARTSLNHWSACFMRTHIKSMAWCDSMIFAASFRQAGAMENKFQLFEKPKRANEVTGDPSARKWCEAE